MNFRKPRYLYKYYSFDKDEYYKDILCRGTLYFSSPKRFNDPFDKGLDIVFIGKSKRFVTNYLLREIIPHSVDNLDRVKEHRTKDFIENNYIGFDPNIKENELQLQKNHLNYVLSSGVCCFSVINNSILMWSHYAEKHSGFCIEFNFRELEKAILSYNKQNDRIIYGQKVIYSKRYPSVSAYKEQIVESVFRKSSNWKYEKEWRFFYSEGAGKTIHLPKGVITAIYLGLYTQPELEEFIKSEISKKTYPIKLYKSKKNKKSFTLDFD